MDLKNILVANKLWSHLRTCQQNSIDKASTYLNNPVSKKSCLISLPTGAGKTGVICTLAHFSEQKRILVLCHRRAVCDQLFKQLRGEFFIKISPEGTFNKKNVFDNVDDSTADGIYVSTFQKLRSMESADLATLKEKVDLLIIDEGHSEPSPVWSQLARNLNAHKIIITATPYRNDLFQFDIDPSVSYIHTFKQSIEDGILSDPTFSTINESILVARVQELLAEQPKTKCIVKCDKFENIEYFFELFSKSFRTLAIHEQYAKDKRPNVKADVPAKIDKSDWEVLVHQRKLDEGVDIPQAKILVLTYTVRSGRELVQTVGRVVRLHQEYNANVLELDGIANSKIWNNYRNFDEYIDNPTSGKKFLNSLNTAGLIDRYLEAFPDISYFGSGFKRKFNLKEFDPVQSLVIPLASVCFIKKKHGFTIPSLIDTLYWDSEKQGELVEIRKDVLDTNILLSICFNNSKFLVDELFFQPSLEIFFVKDLGDFIAVYDSRGRDFSNQEDLLLGASVDTEKLFNLANRSDLTRTKEANTRAIGTANLRPESISIKGKRLESIIKSQGNSSYALTTLKVDNLSAEGVKRSSYYLGVASGRVSDQKNRNFPFMKICTWIDDIGDTLKQEERNRSTLINSYAKSVKEIPTSSPLSVQIDFSGEATQISIRRNATTATIDNNFELYEYDNGIALFNDDLKVTLKLDKDNYLMFFSDHDEASATYIQTVDGKEIPFVDYLNSLPIKVLYPNGLSYFDNKFYKVTLPSENGFKVEESTYGQSLISLDFLQNSSLEEKDESNVSEDSFGINSIFYEIDKLKNIADKKNSIESLGVFYNYISDVDLVFCTDMNTEPADFILSSPTKQVFIHVKCSNKRTPQSSAGAISEVGGQAIKNIEMTVSHDDKLSPANRTTLLGKWPRPNAQNALKDRIRLFDGKRYDSKDVDQVERENKIDEVWGVIAKRRKSPIVKNEVWIIVGRAFSRSHFIEQLNKGSKAQGESLQAFQLMDSWLITAASFDAELKFFVSP
ncbi:DEAD/DEAH box helicase [Acinetobacter junii]|uniref:DEAD/DEAH box helicase n=1 Tax=Acinetobacter junii TaxID=40215 RepID=UPI00143C35D7|nr:DEAD/DEAH box helicase family protein [Acinetobacter junii]NKG33561.1 hypothetical protein [Acinetobacter junii]